MTDFTIHFREMVVDMLVGDMKFHINNFNKCIYEINRYRSFQMDGIKQIFDLYPIEVLYPIGYNLDNIIIIPSGVVLYNKQQTQTP